VNQAPIRWEKMCRLLAQDRGIRVGHKRVARLMRCVGLRSATLCKVVGTTRPDTGAKARSRLGATALLRRGSGMTSKEIPDNANP
jgi:hypothetical protein